MGTNEVAYEALPPGQISRRLRHLGSSRVVAGLDPATPNILPLCFHGRDRRDKPGDDTGEAINAIKIAQIVSKPSRLRDGLLYLPPAVATATLYIHKPDGR